MTLDPDVAALVQKAMRERRLTFKQAINETLRTALRPRPSQAGSRSPTFPMRLRDGIDLTKALQVASDLDDEAQVAKLREGR